MPSKKTKNDFINEAKLIYGNQYDFSQVSYVNTSTKVVIICSKHGEFLKTPYHFIKRKQGCRDCKGYTDWNWSLFVNKATHFHKGHYKYPNQTFTKIKDKYKIICPVHGEFYQSGTAHLKGGCNKCGYDFKNAKQRDSKEEFILKSIGKHGEKYNYSKVDYFNSQSKVIIICPDHGEFEIKANNHSSQGQGCPTCSRLEAQKNIRLGWIEVKERLETQWGNSLEYDAKSYVAYTEKMRVKCVIHGWFEKAPHTLDYGSGCKECGYASGAEKNFIPFSETIKEFKKIHGNKYEYDKNTYEGASGGITILCKKHGEFHQGVQSHKNGAQCPRCIHELNGERAKLSKEEFIKRANFEHGQIYNYDKVNWIDQHSDVTIVCPKHGDFIQKPREHYRGSGCTTCNASRGERKIKILLDERKEKYNMQQKFFGLENKGQLRCDFYLTERKTVIEYN